MINLKLIKWKQNMFWNKLKNFFKEKSGATVMAATLSSPVAYAQSEPKVEESKQDKTEQVVIQEVLKGDQIYMSINGNPVHANVYSDLKENLENYYEDQKESFENREQVVETDTISFDDFSFERQLAYYDLGKKNVTMNYVDGNKKDDILYYVEQNYMNMSLEEQDQKAQNISSMLARYNNKYSVEYLSLLAHELQHMVNDENGLYAPGLSVEQYGVLNQYDEVSATLVEFLVLDFGVQKQVQGGVPLAEALKIFDRPEFSCFAFYKDLALKKENMSKADYNRALFAALHDSWQKNFQKTYENQVIFSMKAKCESYDAASLAFGNEKEFDKRLKRMFDRIKDNPVLKRLGVEVDNFSKYLPEKKMPLSDEVQKAAEKMALHYTGMTPEFARKLGKAMPGNAKKDASNLLKILSKRQVSKKVARKFVVKNETRDLTAVKNLLSRKNNTR